MPPGSVIGLDAGEAVRADRYGRRAADLARLTALGLPVPPGIALSFACVADLAAGGPMPDLPRALPPGTLLALRCSPEERAWGGASAILNIGLTDAQRRRPRPSASAPPPPSASTAASSPPSPMPFTASTRRTSTRPSAATRATSPAQVAEMLAFFEEETGEPWPQDPALQLEAAARAMARAWAGASARILRQAKGAPEAAGLGLVVQRLALGLGPGLCGSGHMQGGQQPHRRSRPRRRLPPAGPGQRRPPRRPRRRARSTSSDATRSRPSTPPPPKPPAPSATPTSSSSPWRTARSPSLDATPLRRTGRAAVRIAVDLAHTGAITREQALLRIEPRSLIEHLHPQIDPAAPRDVFAKGLAASPGAATGHIVFTAEAAQAAAAQDEATILVRLETSPEDIRGMHAARGVLTVRGGMSSHAAVIARGLGLPCVVGASQLRIDSEAGALITPDGRILHEGALITLDGTRGEVHRRRPRHDPARARRRLLRASRLGRRRPRPRGARQRRHPRRGAHGARVPRRRPRPLPQRAHVLRRRAHHGDARDDPRRYRRRAPNRARPAPADAARGFH